MIDNSLLGFIVELWRRHQGCVRVSSVFGCLLACQWKSGFSGKVQPVLLMITLAA